MDRFVVPLAGILLLVGLTYVTSLFMPSTVSASGSSFSTSSMPGASATPDSQIAAGTFATKLDGKLVIMDGREMKDFDASKMSGVKYWAFYASASWCPPCRAFTPSLVTFYKWFKPTHPNFELIFVNEDEDEADMVAYMNDDAMTWPAVRFGLRRNSGLGQYFGNYIPDLVLVDGNGNVLSDTNENGQYVGPEKVIGDIQRMVPTP